MENLTKENFFNELGVKDPALLRTFCTWIDQYKIENNWEETFKRSIYGSELRTPKFHEIPFDIQIGIIAKFLRHMNGGLPAYPDIVKSLMETLVSYGNENVGN